MFGDLVFGDLVYADLDSLTGRRRGGRGIGGSGFPENYFEILAANQAAADRERRRLARELEEVAVLVHAGLL